MPAPQSTFYLCSQGLLPEPARARGRGSQPGLLQPPGAVSRAPWLPAWPSWHTQPQAPPGPGSPQQLCREASRALPPQCPGFGQTHSCAHPDHGEGVLAGLVWAQPFLCPQHRASRSWGRRAPPLSCCPAHLSQQGPGASTGQRCLGRAVPVKY